MWNISYCGFTSNLKCICFSYLHSFEYTKCLASSRSAQAQKGVKSVLQKEQEWLNSILTNFESASLRSVIQILRFCSAGLYRTAFASGGCRLLEGKWHSDYISRYQVGQAKSPVVSEPKPMVIGLMCSVLRIISRGQQDHYSLASYRCNHTQVGCLQASFLLFSLLGPVSFSMPLNISFPSFICFSHLAPLLSSSSDLSSLFDWMLRKQRLKCRRWSWYKSFVPTLLHVLLPAVCIFFYRRTYSYTVVSRRSSTSS